MTIKTDDYEISDTYGDLTVRELLKALEDNKPQKNMSYILHISAYGISVTKGQQSSHYHTLEQYIQARNDKAFEMVVKSKEEKKKEAEHFALTDIQKERKALVLEKQKLSDAMVERIRLEEFPNNHEFFFNKNGHCYGASHYDKTEQALRVRGIMFDTEICQMFKLSNPLAWMTDEGFSIWRGDAYEGKIKDA